MMRHVVVLQSFLGLAGVRLDDEFDLHINARESSKALKIESTFHEKMTASLAVGTEGVSAADECVALERKEFMKQQKELCLDLRFLFAGLTISVGVIGQVEYTGPGPFVLGYKKLSVTLTGSVMFGIPWTLSVAFTVGGSMTIVSESSENFLQLLQYAVSGVIRKRFKEEEMQNDESLKKAVQDRLKAIEIPYADQKKWATWAIGMADTLNIFLTSLGISIQTEAESYKIKADQVKRLLEKLTNYSVEEKSRLLEGLSAEPQPWPYEKIATLREEIVSMRQKIQDQSKYKITMDTLLGIMGASPLLIKDGTQYFVDQACHFLPETETGAGVRNSCSIMPALGNLNIDLVELRLGLVRDFARSIAEQISQLFVGSGWDTQKRDGENDWNFDCTKAGKQVEITLNPCISQEGMTCYDGFREKISLIGGLIDKKLVASGATLCNLFEAARIDPNVIPPNVAEKLKDYDWQINNMRVPHSIVNVLPLLFHDLRSEQLAAISDLEGIRGIQSLTSAVAEVKIEKLTGYIKSQQKSFKGLEDRFRKIAQTDQYALEQAKTTGTFHAKWDKDKCQKSDDQKSDDQKSDVPCAEAIQGHLLQRVNIEETVKKIQNDMTKIADKLEAAAQNQMTVDVTGEVFLKLAITIAKPSDVCLLGEPTFQLDTAMSLNDKFNVNLDDGEITQAESTKVQMPTVRGTIAPFQVFPVASLNSLSGMSYSFSIGSSGNDPRKHVVSLPFSSKSVEEDVGKIIDQIAQLQPALLRAIYLLVDVTSPVDADPNLYNEVYEKNTSAAQNLENKVSQIFSHERWWPVVEKILNDLNGELGAQLVLAGGMMKATVKMEISLTTTPDQKKLGIQVSRNSAPSDDLKAKVIELAKQHNVLMLSGNIGDATLIDLTGALVNSYCTENTKNTKMKL